MIAAAQLLPPPDPLHPEESYSASVADLLGKWLYSGWLQESQKGIKKQLLSHIAKDFESLRSLHEGTMKRLQDKEEDVMAVSKACFSKDAALARVRKRADRLTRSLRRAKAKNRLMCDKYEAVTGEPARFRIWNSPDSADEDECLEVLDVERDEDQDQVYSGPATSPRRTPQ